YLCFYGTRWRELAVRLAVALQALQIGSEFRGGLPATLAVRSRHVLMISSSFTGISGLSRTAGVGTRSRIAWQITPEMSPQRVFCPSPSRTKPPKWRQIASRIQFLAAHLLRRHVGHRPHHRSGAGQVLRVYFIRCQGCAVLVHTLRECDFGKPKSRI